MKNISKKKKKLLVLSSCLVVLTTSKTTACEDTEIIYNDNFEINSSECFATYKNYNIYIGNQEYIDSIEDENSNNIYVIDSRDSSDPTMSICNSYKIKNIITMSKIIDALLEYESKYPSNWNRTKSSSLLEWGGHNCSAFLGYEVERTRRVDLNNRDEKWY